MHYVFKTFFNNFLYFKLFMNKTLTNMREIFRKRLSNIAVLHVPGFEILYTTFFDSLNFSKRPLTTEAYMTSQSLFVEPEHTFVFDFPVLSYPRHCHHFVHVTMRQFLS